MKLPGNDETIKTNMLNQKMLEDQIEELQTTRSCPTGYFDCELKKTATVELLYLRKSLYEYLNGKSKKTRNLQFIHLIKRINKELTDRNVNIPIRNINCYDSLKNFDEISIYLNSSMSSYGGEYCYLARKRSGSSDKSISPENIIISTNYFSFSNILPQSAIPNFIQDNNIKNQIQFKDYEVIQQLNSDSGESDIKHQL